MNISEENFSEKLLSLLKSLKLPTEDFAVFGSGPMYAHGIKELGHDLDLIARGVAWEKAKEHGIAVPRMVKVRL
jgi:predicted nucleotidyltransferase